MPIHWIMKNSINGCRHGLSCCVVLFIIYLKLFVIRTVFVVWFEMNRRRISMPPLLVKQPTLPRNYFDTCNPGCGCDDMNDIDLTELFVHHLDDCDDDEEYTRKFMSVNPNCSRAVL